MSKYVKLLTSTLLVPLLVFGTVSAIVEESGDSPRDVDSEITITQSEANSQNQSGDLREGIKERLLKRKQKRQISLTSAEEQRLKGRCTASQNRLRTMATRLDKLEANRNTVYGNMQNRLNSLVERLNNRGFDVSELEEAVDGITKSIETFNTNLADYKQTVSDLAEMECENDPEGFKASLEEGRDLLSALREESQAIKLQLRQKVIPALKSVLAQLQESVESEEE